MSRFVGFCVTYTGSGLDAGFIDTLCIHTTRIYRQLQRYSYFHTLQFTVTHALEFEIFSSRILAMDLPQPTASSLQITHGILFSQPKSLSWPYSAAANSEDPTQFNFFPPNLISWQATFSKFDFRLLLSTLCQVKVKVSLRLTVSQSVSQSVSLGVEPHLGLMTRYILLFDNYGLAFVGRPLWREDGSAFCICCWPLPVQSFSGPSPYFTVSELRLPFSSPLTTRRVTVKVFDPSSTRETMLYAAEHFSL
jgi:hypothetical protein